MAAVHKHHHNRRALPIPRVFRDRLDHLEYSNGKLCERYRLRRRTVIRLHEEFREGLERDTKRKMTLTPILSLLLCLRFLATGASHLLIGDSLHISRNAAGREIRTVSLLIVRAFKHILDIPLGDMEHKVMEDFRKIAGGQGQLTTAECGGLLFFAISLRQEAFGSLPSV
ncbi:uncharacterized protein LOC144624490 [Crassostrea virginica]